MSEPFNFKDSNINPNVLDLLRNSIQYQTFEENNRQREKQLQVVANKRKEKEDREIRMLEINEEKLEYDKFKLFLLSSVNRDQRFMLEKIDSLIDTIEFSNRVVEGNLAIIEEELISLKESTDNLNESFIQLIQKKMMEQGVEEAIKWLFIGFKTLFLTNN